MSEQDTSKRGQPALAWLVILLVVALILWRSATRETPADSASWLVPLQSQARYLVGASSYGLPGMTGERLFEEARKTLDRGTYSQRLRFAVLAGELVGPAEARSRLALLEQERRDETLEARPSSLEAARLLDHLYAGHEKDPKEPVLSAEAQERLREGLGWFGDLALAPAGTADSAAREAALAPARRTTVVFMLLGIFIVAALLTGGGLLLITLALWWTGSMSGRLPARVNGRGDLYVEAFALYMVLYVGLGWLGRFLPDTWPQLVTSAAAMFLSLAALGWPLVRGLRWQQVREDLGLFAGPRPLVEAGAGLGTYLCAVPLLVGGVLVMFALARGLQYLGINKDPLGPGGLSHPIVGLALEKGWLIWVQVFLVACVAAPVVEEIMFRGLLYRHLREQTGRWHAVLSVTLAALGSAFVFAVIHPQGWLGVPMLMALAASFALAREWRGSLVAPMVAHALNNGVSTLVLLLTAG